ncbi:MAG: apolipoprotein N-acyltransferase [Alphaproteobacteria bacterium]|nr:apolipoprotein N-acyltransferase [Alphaproteobacteria bacterium]
MILIPFLLGISATLTLPPFYIFPLVIPAYGGLFLLLKRAETPGQAAKIGFFWGWGFYISGLYWFVIALLTDPDRFAWLIPFALFALTAVIALYTTLFAWSWFRIRLHGIGGAVAFSALWTAIEWLRGHLFTGFPWNLGGYVFGISDASIQLAAQLGIYWLTFVAVLLGTICVVHKRVAILCWALLAASVGWGAWRVHQAPQEFVEGVRIRLVQANIQQHHKWAPALQMQGLQAHIDLTQSAELEKVTHIIWPETAVPYVLKENSTLAVRLGLVLYPGQHLITGVLRGDQDRITNGIAAINPEGKIVGAYDKFKLVPFGEFLPLRWLIPDALETPVGMRDMDRGDGAKTLDWPGLPLVSPLICYEVIFPELALRGDKKPAWLLSITNDAWFGNSTGPYQHLAMARMRAVEQGIPMVRVANTGITAAYDGYGREIARIPLNQKGFVDIGLPKAAK